MATAAISGYGSTITFGGTAVTETMITGPENTRDQLDATTHSSTSAAREFIPGLKDGGEVTLEGNWVPSDAGQTALLSSYDNGTTSACVITYAGSAGTCTFNGFVSGFNIAPPHDEKLTFTATIKVTGPVTYA
jgi:predicted secreted protein